MEGDILSEGIHETCSVLFFFKVFTFHASFLYLSITFHPSVAHVAVPRSFTPSFTFALRTLNDGILW